MALSAQWLSAWLEHVALGAPLWAGPTGELSLFLGEGHWRPDGVFVQMIAKLDEAGTHGHSSYMTMGGYAATLRQWRRFDHRWVKSLRKAGLPYFHVKEHGDHPFALKAVKIADENLTIGFVVRLDKNDYQQFYRNDSNWGGKNQPDSMYGLCFRYCLSLVLQVALAELPHQGLVVNFVVEDGHQNSGAPTEIVRQLRKKNISGVSEYLGNAVPGDKEKIPGLQAADGVTSGAWHMEKHGTPVLGPPQPPALQLPRWRAVDPGARHEWNIPILRCHIDGPELTTFKGGYFAHLEKRRQWGRDRSPNYVPPVSPVCSSGESE
jgi:hypothetical protein